MTSTISESEVDTGALLLTRLRSSSVFISFHLQCVYELKLTSFLFSRMVLILDISADLCDYCCSVTKLCSTLRDPMDCSTPGFPVLHYLLESAKTHVHCVNDAIQPSYLLLPPSPVFFSLSRNRVFTSDLALPIRWPKYWSFSFSISPSSEYSGLFFSLGLTSLILLCKGQQHSSKASVLQCSAFFMVQLWHPYMATGKTIALTIRTFVGKVILAFLYVV